VGDFADVFRDEGAANRVLELIVRHNVHHEPPEFRLENAMVPLHDLDNRGKVMHLTVICQG